ncbi:dual specificity protein phosphatase family protein [uncultured Olleya sp.]|uniref:fused DSP-PTPase phosphatase/NAD kinase-like protein n=1 Tax=uncultured Olleya sp. TaxID=757243 RepID=UPI0025973CC0|nr:dual specificity protein phosphatase family protein [uncultured Olleya sp.]
MKKLTIVYILFVTFGYAQNTNDREKQDDNIEIKSKNFDNLYRINDSIYRSEQPSKKGFIELDTSGIKTIVNLRRLRNDIKKAKGTDLQLEHIPLATKQITEQDIFEVIQHIDNAEKPLLIHCWHGSDRTGVMVAAYRIVIENWSKEKAIKEFRNKKFGYHENKYPNLLYLLEHLNVEDIKKQLKTTN